MTPLEIALLALQIIGGATVLFRTIAPLTETKKDDKILKFLEAILANVALNKSDGDSKLEIKLKRK